MRTVAENLVVFIAVVKIKTGIRREEMPLINLSLQIKRLFSD